jgi:tRNA(Glu) U13 pseudouridine synthase TruD
MEYTLKKVPEDFVVTEIQESISVSDEGAFFFVWMKKRNMATLQALSYISRVLKIKEKEIGSAGYKDKHAVTEQGITIPKRGFTKEQIEAITVDNNAQLRLSVKGMVNQPLYPGFHDGNYFIICIRNVTEPFGIKDRFETKPIFNYFGEQRFSSHNHEYGRLILKQSFKEAVEMIISHEENTRVGKDLYNYLLIHPGDYVGALRSMNKRILLLYIQAYQSYLWNKIVSYYATYANRQETDIFLPGYGMPTYNDQNLTDSIETVLQEEGITKRDFFIRSIPELSQKGSSRPLHAPISEFDADEWKTDSQNDNRHEITVSFRLKKGAYATEVIRQLCADSPR